MAEAIIISPLLQVAFESLNSLIQDEVSLVWGVKQELENLSSTLSAIKSVLKDAEEKQVKDNSVRDWLKKLKDVAYKVDNVLDEYATEASRWKLAEHTTNSCNMQVSNFLTCIYFKKVFFRRSIGHKIREINDRLSKIAEERLNFHLREGVPERNAQNIRETYSFVDERTILGRESEKKKIVDLLLSSDDMVDVFVIPIVGMGGLGKTTLAKFVYNDEEIKKHFQLRMWVCVSENFEIKRLIKLMIESAIRKDCKLQGLDPLQDDLRKTLSGKRFLLVLDDVWNEDQGKWDMLKHLLIRGGEKGSRIIVTTRSEKVSVIMGTTSSSTHLEGFSDDECWSLIKQRAFGERMEGVQPNLVNIGMEIAKKCKGVPLAAKTLGSMLRFRREESEWLQIRDSEAWSHLLKENEDDNILNVLRISYDHLPCHLKQCFTYCSLYPKDYKMEREELIKLWMAQGFIQQPSKESGREIEDIGSDYINDLLWGSFFQYEERDFYGEITYKMHDLMHDLAQFIAKDECLGCIQFGKVEEAIAHNKPYHLSLVNDGLVVPQTIPEMLYKCSYLRTLLMFNPFYPDIVVVCAELFLKLRCLRVLDLRCCAISKLPDSIGNLKHLRYLNLSVNPPIKSLPETICNLWNLQTLDLSYCDISKLPDSIGNLKHLRYLNLSGNRNIQSLPETICNLLNLQTLDIRYCHGISKLPKRIKNLVGLRHLEMNTIKYMPSGIGRLTCLQTLRVYRVGEAESEFGGLGELQNLINLRGELAIEELGNAKDIEEAKKANLRGNQHLHTLELEWTYGRGQVNAQEEEGVLEALQPHTNLRHLTIGSYGGSKFPSWMGNSSFTNLVSISLYDFSYISCECLPSFGKLPLLKELRIVRVHGVKYFSTIDGSNYNEENTLGFPSLEKLELDEMPDLEDWSTSGEGNLSHLSVLDIRNCPKLRALPKLPSLKKLRLYEMPNLEDLSAGVEGNLSFLLKLDIRNCPKLRALPKLPSLKKLRLHEMPNLEDLSACVEGNLSFLLKLDINKCQKLWALPKLPSLERLVLDEMPNLEDWSESGEGNLSRLRELTIRKCPKLWALLELLSLEKLELYDTPNLEDWSAIGEGNLNRLCELNIRNYHSNLRRALPNLKILTLTSRDDEIPLTWEHLPSLESLSIESCFNITSLPDSIKNLSTLKNLDILNCPKLGSLPEGLKHLHALEGLNIESCPLLRERCKEGGEDWPNITHVASIDIDYKKIK